MVLPLDPTASAFLFAENRHMPMHVGALQLFERPEGAGDDFVRRLYEDARDVSELNPLFLRRPRRSKRLGGQWIWEPDDQYDPEHHVRHSALPQPGRIRELLELCGRLHSTRLARERPLWEAHVIEGLDDGRVALYTKVHHSLMDGISAVRLIGGVLSEDPAERGMEAAWAASSLARIEARRAAARDDADDGSDGEGSDGDGGRGLLDLPVSVVRSALGISAEAAGMPAALLRTLTKGVLDQTSSISLHAPRTMFNAEITGARRFAAEDWPVERLKAVAHASGTTLNDVVLAMCSGAMRTYLNDLGELPDSSLVAMVPVGLKAKQSHLASGDGGNAVGAVMVRLATDLDDAGDRLSTIHASMQDGKDALASMTPAQIVAMSALGQTPAILTPMLKLQGVVRPPYNLIISNVPGPRDTLYWNGARLTGSYPLSIPINGMALNITCTSYDGNLAFGLTGCRRTVPHLQRLLVHLEDEVAALEKAVGVPGAA
ncbi:WS/DGAT/MGAT family O-acyltransferase [Nocardioides sp. AX2bis]|uniref:WS/DGAT/MGAT family O-acyltransferase n=1 Tax=Nocardioides sp. AX2bis TaxID=2653157 RepID=UPI0012F21D60|nr:wax ester/triacylglycerol synthase family O-acyltransferase [Nocardioides sp. AX2bis]VXC08638.1 Diacylglycerol O-acyltransferase [Nocardioides sp. AX2bis]